MIRFLADENFNGRILRGVRRENPDADILRVQDSPVSEALILKCLNGQHKKIEFF